MPGNISGLLSPKLSSKPLTRVRLFESRIKRNRRSSIFRINAPLTPQLLPKNLLAAKICRLNVAISIARSPAQHIRLMRPILRRSKITTRSRPIRRLRSGKRPIGCSCTSAPAASNNFNASLRRVSVCRPKTFGSSARSSAGRSVPRAFSGATAFWSPWQRGGSSVR